MQTLTSKFLIEISQTHDILSFYAVARILKVPLLNSDNSEMRPFTDIFSDVVAAYDSSPRKRKRELLKILSDANKVKEADFDASQTENSDAN